MTGIDLSQLPPPNFVELPSLEDILAEAKAEIISAHPEFAAALEVEGEPMLAVLQVVALREYLTRQAVNDAALQCTLAFATGANLEHIAAFHGVQRQLIDEGDPKGVPPVPPTFESDEALRERTRLAPRSFSSTGTPASWVYHALTAGQEPISTWIFSPESGVVTTTRRFESSSIVGKVRDASAQRGDTGEVVITVLGHPDDPILAPELLEELEDHLRSDEVRQVTASVRVETASLLGWSLTATLHVAEGPDSTIIQKMAEANLKAYAADQFRLGGSVVRSGIDAALHVAGVNKVVLSDWSDIEADLHEAPELDLFNIVIS